MPVFIICQVSTAQAVAKKRYEAVGFPYNCMVKLSWSGGIRIDVPVLSVSWSFVDHSVIIQALRKGLIEREASDTGGVSRWKSSCPDRLTETTVRKILINRPPSKSIVWAIPINRQYSKSIFRTILLNRKSPNIIVQTMSTCRQSPKSITRTIQTSCAY